MAERFRQEREPQNGDSVGFKIRLLLGGEALNPQNTSLALPSQESLGTFQNRDYTIFNRASTHERKEHWRQSGGDFETQKSRWADELTRIFREKNFTEQEQEMFSAFDVDVENFTEDQAGTIYDRYFAGDETESNTHQFVFDMFLANAIVRDETIQLDPEKVRNNLDVIRWFSSIFGEKSRQVIANLVDAELTLITDPQQFLKQEETVLNQFGPQEEKLLRFLWQFSEGVEERPQEEVSPPRVTQPLRRPYQLPENYRKVFEKAEGDPRILANDISFIENPRWIANKLKEDHPERYAGVSPQQLERHVAREQQDLQTSLEAHDLGMDRLVEMTGQVLAHFGQYLQNTYGIELPNIANLRLFPVSGHTSFAFCEGNDALAYVSTTLPVLFLNFDVLTNAAKNLKRTDWTELTPDQLTELLTRLLLEVIPHEYTHLAADMSFLKVIKQEEDGAQSTKLKTTVKSGVEVAKPIISGVKDDGDLEFETIRRGHLLHEAITEEIVYRWAQSFGSPLDNEGYPKERTVLRTLINFLSDEQEISEHETFAKFVKAHFDPHGFMPLVQELSGRRMHHDGSVSYERPYFLSHVYALMDYENGKIAERRNLSYPISIAYIQNELSQQQAAEILDQIDDLLLSLGAKRQLVNQLIRSALPLEEAA